MPKSIYCEQTKKLVMLGGETAKHYRDQTSMSLVVSASAKIDMFHQNLKFISPFFLLKLIVCFCRRSTIFGNKHIINNNNKQ